MTDSKRQAHSKVVEMVLKGKKSSEATASAANFRDCQSLNCNGCAGRLRHFRPQYWRSIFAV